MNMLVNVPRVWELLAGFKSLCQSKNWITCEYDDSVKVERELHKFLWARSIQPSTFEKIAKLHYCARKKGTTYEVVKVAYTAWLFYQSPSNKILQKLTKNNDLTKKNALYDLSSAYEGNPICLKLNKTESIVFREFEEFLENKWQIEFQQTDF